MNALLAIVGSVLHVYQVVRLWQKSRALRGAWLRWFGWLLFWLFIAVVISQVFHTPAVWALVILGVGGIALLTLSVLTWEARRSGVSPDCRKESADSALDSAETLLYRYRPQETHSGKSAYGLNVSPAAEPADERWTQDDHAEQAQQRVVPDPSARQEPQIERGEDGHAVYGPNK